MTNKMKKSYLCKVIPSRKQNNNKSIKHYTQKNFPNIVWKRTITQIYKIIFSALSYESLMFFDTLSSKIPFCYHKVKMKQSRSSRVKETTFKKHLKTICSLGFINLWCLLYSCQKPLNRYILPSPPETPTLY